MGITKTRFCCVCKLYRNERPFQRKKETRNTRITQEHLAPLKIKHEEIRVPGCTLSRSILRWLVGWLDSVGRFNIIKRRHEGPSSSPAKNQEQEGKQT